VISVRFAPHFTLTFYSVKRKAQPHLLFPCEQTCDFTPWISQGGGPTLPYL
jgi:hypothetical protein